MTAPTEARCEGSRHVSEKYRAQRRLRAVAQEARDAGARAAEAYVNRRELGRHVIASPQRVGGEVRRVSTGEGSPRTTPSEFCKDAIERSLCHLTQRLQVSKQKLMLIPDEAHDQLLVESISDLDELSEPTGTTRNTLGFSAAACSDDEADEVDVDIEPTAVAGVAADESETTAAVGVGVGSNTHEPTVASAKVHNVDADIASEELRM